MATIKEILSMPLAQRKNSIYNATKQGNIEKIIIDGMEFTDYGAFSFVWEKTYEKSPERSISGQIDNFNDYASFITPHLSINFSLLSIDSYRNLMKLLYSKNEFTVTCYDIVFNEQTTNNMYFATEQMPKLWTITRSLSNNDNWVELIAVEDYTVEMIGTNTNVKKLTLVYDYNIPADAMDDWEYQTSATITFPKNRSVRVGADATIYVINEYQKLQDASPAGRYFFQYWCTSPDGQGLIYIDDDEYMFLKNTTLYAIWK